MVITLTGFMGCGKSSVGRILAERLGWKFTDLDEYIVHKKGMSITDIFATEGEEYFRALEAECVRDVVVMSRITGEDTVLALGGGTLTYRAVRWLVLGQTESVRLKASLSTCLSRIGDCTSSRPLLEAGKAEEDINGLFEARESVYALAKHTVDNDTGSASEAADRVIAAVFGKTHQ